MKPSLVLDSCALLDLITQRWEDEQTARLLQEADRPVILSISIWEISRKHLLGKLSLPCESDGILSFVREVCAHFSISILPVSDVISFEAEQFPLHHRDPFDRMILAAAKLANCPVITSDRNFEDYEVEVCSHR